MNSNNAGGIGPGQGQVPDPNTPSRIGFSKLSAPMEGATPPGGLPPLAAAGIMPRQGGVLPTKRRKLSQKKLNVQELIKMLYRGRWIILATFLAMFAYTVYSTYSKPFIYSAWTRMLIEKKPVQKVAGLSTMEDDHSIANQLQFFRSHVVGQHVARLIRDHAIGVRTELDSLFIEYFGNTNAIPPNPGLLRIAKVVDNPKLPQKPGLTDVATIEARASTAVSIAPDPANDYLNISAEAYTPQDAAFIVNTYAVVFAKDNLARSRFNSAALKDFLAAQLKRSYDTLYHVESELKDYLSEASGLSVDERAADLVKQLEESKQKYANLELEVTRNRNVYEDLSTTLDTVSKNFFNNLTLEPYIAMLQSELATTQFAVEQARSSNNIMHPSSKKYLKDNLENEEERIALLNQQLKAKSEELLHSQVIVPTAVKDGAVDIVQNGTSVNAVTRLRESRLHTKQSLEQDAVVLDRLRSQIDVLEAELHTMPEKVIRAAQLKRAQASAARLYGQLEDKYMDAWLSEQSVFGSVKLEDPAGLNAAPIRPNRQASIFTGALLGLAIGMAIVVVMSFMDSTVRSPDELEAQGLSVLSTIPIINHPTQQTSQAFVDANKKLPKFTPHRVAHLDSRSSVAESYRSLRTAVQFAGLDKSIRTIAVTSSAPQEGKSTTSSNLGIVMAQMGKRTLLIDSDLRRPVLHSVFALDREPGLTNLLFDRATLMEAVQKTDVPNLFVLPCGIIPPNPAELLGSEKMRKLMIQLQEEFDMVIFDTPPVVAVTDALLLGRSVDAVLLIARSDVSRTDAIIRSVDMIERSGANLIGVVLNNFNVANAYGAYYRYYQYYHYYSSETPQKKTLAQRLRLGRPVKLKKEMEEA